MKFNLTIIDLIFIFKSSIFRSYLVLDFLFLKSLFFIPHFKLKTKRLNSNLVMLVFLTFKIFKEKKKESYN